MAYDRLKPKNDFIFKRLFGEQETKESLISLLNAIMRLEGSDQIVDLTVIENKELLKENIEDKTGRLDVRAETKGAMLIDVEVQLRNQKNMVKRTLYYLAKMYAQSISEGDDYTKLKKTVTINILDFNLFAIERFHSTFHFYEDHEEAMLLTDALEVHFVEYPKFKKMKKSLEDPLHRWLLFLDESLQENERKELIEMDPVIRKAEERLEWLSSDAETRRLYEARKESMLERNTLIVEGREEGREEGKKEGKKEGEETTQTAIVLSMLKQGFKPEEIARITELDEDWITKLSESFEKDDRNG
ncbi:Rpn family recombination-promoting nuclease/putative transposase [Salicibibacter kimchii]|uniref:Rpn family recombination-promoting nuclease/putative transposase n=1 Tax=Salicibibacter kimchii TaxID=2099786 RepID=A0A345C025_9BACI|nr:Rpn family recombination-promoting nuclease/putative transposase [Salicibibacter kimchii]AXF56556.1 Rpn family recombination-promoting nuclease/putative transposase [Salicibibacter kimchii]